MKLWGKVMSADTSGGGVRKMEYFMSSRWEEATIKYGEKEEGELDWDSELWKRDGGRQKEIRMSKNEQGRRWE